MRDLPVPDDAPIGTPLAGRYEVLSCIGKGAMGAIYRCRDQQTDTQVAIKVLKGELADDPEVVARFIREIDATGRIDHPNVVQVLGHSSVAGEGLYLVMELLHGVTLAEIIWDEGPLSTEQVARLGAQIARGLHAAHAHGIVHRDLKPENVIVLDEGKQAKVFDFGLGLRQAESPSGQGERLTRLDMRIGTPIYMAPEYIGGAEPAPSCDLYALGVVLYEAATGVPPFDGPAHRVLHEHVHAPPQPIAERVPGRHPAWLRAIIASLLAKDPARRPQSGAEVAAQLEAGRKQAPDLSWPVVAMVVAAAVVLHALFLSANIGRTPDLPVAGDFATPYYALQVAMEGGDPYDKAALQEAATGTRSTVAALFHPPMHLLAAAWSLPLELKTAYYLSIALNELALLATIGVLWLWWRPLGSAVPTVLAATVAMLTAIAMHHDTGQIHLLLMALVFAALWLDHAGRPWIAGILFGLAGALSLRVLLFAVLFASQRRFRPLGAAAATFAFLAGVSVPLVGTAAHTRYWTEVLPAALQGNFTGIGVRIDAFANHSVSNLLAVIGGGPGQSLTPLALVLQGGLVVATLGLLGWLYRRPTEDVLTRGAQAASVGVAAILLPVYGLEHHLVWAIPAIAIAVLALYRGRIPSELAVPVGLAAAILAYPLIPLRTLYTLVMLPGLPAVAPLIPEMKCIALVGLLVVTTGLGAGWGRR